MSRDLLSFRKVGTPKIVLIDLPQYALLYYSKIYVFYKNISKELFILQ